MEVSEIEGGWSVTPPTRRFDIAIEEDLIEEVVRLAGYDRVPRWRSRESSVPGRIPKPGCRSPGFAGCWWERGYQKR